MLQVGGRKSARPTCVACITAAPFAAEIEMGERRSFASGPRSPSLYVILYVHAESHMKGVAGASGEAAATNAEGPTEPRAKRARHCSSLTDSGPSSAHRSRAASRRWWAAASGSRATAPARDPVALRAVAEAANASYSASAAKRRWTYSSLERVVRVDLAEPEATTASATTVRRPCACCCWADVGRLEPVRTCT